MSEPRSPIRLVIAEDQAMVRDALAALLSLEQGLCVVGRACDGQEALELARSLRPDVVVADLEMPRLTGIELAAAIRAEELGARVVIATTFARPGYLQRAIAAGASGYVLKAAPAARLADAVRRAHAGLRVLDPELAAEAMAEPDPLSERERQVLRLADAGRSSAEIADSLGLSAGTVRNYLSEAIGKLGAQNRVEAARAARAKGWL